MIVFMMTSRQFVFAGAVAGADDFDFIVSGFTPLGGGAGAANSMRPAVRAFAETNVSGDTTGSIFQSEKTTSCRSASGSARYIARMRRGSLSSAPIQI